jgi:hypothetical protein
MFGKSLMARVISEFKQDYGSRWRIYRTLSTGGNGKSTELLAWLVGGSRAEYWALEVWTDEWTEGWTATTILQSPSKPSSSGATFGRRHCPFWSATTIPVDYRIFSQPVPALIKVRWSSTALALISPIGPTSTTRSPRTPTWQSYVGTVVVAHKNGKALLL